jgi:plasmid stabilization system protein ParE
VTAQRFSVLVWDEAASQIEEANDWWRAHRRAAPDALVEDLERAFDLIARQPGIGTPARSGDLPDVRRLLLPRVGYFLYYRVVPSRREVNVLALWHARRGAGPPLEL